MLSPRVPPRELRRSERVIVALWHFRVFFLAMGLVGALANVVADVPAYMDAIYSLCLMVAAGLYLLRWLLFWAARSASRSN